MGAKVLLFYEKEGVSSSFLYSKTYFSLIMFRTEGGSAWMPLVEKLKALPGRSNCVILCGYNRKML